MNVALVTLIHALYEALSLPLAAELPVDLVDMIKKHLLDAQKNIEAMVVANVTGEAVRFAHGISIYFPQYHIDASYPRTKFAQEIPWLAFVNDALMQ